MYKDSETLGKKNTSEHLISCELVLLNTLHFGEIKRILVIREEFLSETNTIQLPWN